ncbi:MAG: DUF58 domain-containing protein [Lachnoclostridium sp.]|nr:DUF58 domain-containing protein [Lachnospira sp.]MCM1248085.1 DUF58 domain-containing protein [Lachnoclostridium sp.]
MIKLAGIGLLAFLLLLLEQRIYRKLWSSNLTVSVHFRKKNILEGEESELVEIVENRKKLPISMLKVKFQTDRNLLFEASEGSKTTDKYYRNDVFQIGGGEKITRTLIFKGGKRGLYEIRNIDLVAADLFLTEQMFADCVVNTSLFVYPKPFYSEELRQSLRQLNGEILSKRHLLEDPFEYRGVREYEPYDDMRSINWKATAKTGDLKVNQKNYTALKAVRIFLNLEDSGVWKKSNCVEASIQIVAGLCEAFLKEGMQVACYSNARGKDGSFCLSVEASSGEGQMHAIYRGLALLDEENVLPCGEAFGDRLSQKGQENFTCFVSPNQYDDWMKMMEEYQELSEDFVWFYPVEGMGEPEILAPLRKYARVIHL